MPTVIKKAVRLKEIWDALTRDDIRERNVEFQEVNLTRKRNLERMDILFVHDDEVFVVECDDGSFWVEPNNTRPHEKRSFDKIVDDIMEKGFKTIAPEEGLIYGGYAKTWEEIVALADKFHLSTDNWPTDPNKPIVPKDLQDPDDEDEDEQD